MIQIGARIIIKATTNPKGLIYIDCNSWPLAKEITDLVEPHEGQGIPVMCFIIQTSVEPLRE